ncbi:unnamed protein product [Rotaria sp. Silwood1]|nr:unnamed protein product [Rotaria sp. Silwood1]
MAARPISANGDRYSASLYSQGNTIPEIARFKNENIILLQLDFPSRTTRDYEGPMVSPMIQAAIENAMKDEEHIELDAKKSTANNGGYDNYSSSASRAGYGDIQTGRGINSARR